MELRGGASIFPPKIAFVCFQLFLHSSGLFGGDAERESIRYKVNSENTICCFFFCLETVLFHIIGHLSSWWRWRGQCLFVTSRELLPGHYMLQRVKTFIVDWIKKTPGHAPCFMTKLAHFGSITAMAKSQRIFFCLKSNCNLKLILKHANSDDKDQRTSCKRDFILLWFREGWQGEVVGGL